MVRKNLRIITLLAPLAISGCGLLFPSISDISPGDGGTTTGGSSGMAGSSTSAPGSSGTESSSQASSTATSLASGSSGTVMSSSASGASAPSSSQASSSQGGSSSSGSQSSSGMTCNLPADCGTVPNACTTFTCTNHVCGVSFVGSGTIISDPMHNCTTTRCDGGGNLLSISDTTDPPLDQDACHVGGCNGTTPTQTARSAGFACNFGGGSVCTTAGTCVACLVAADCGTDTDCQSFTCEANNTCTTHNVTAGTAVPNQTAGNCHTVQCDGNGGSANNIDNLDVPEDNNFCTSNTCTNGAPSNPADPSKNTQPCGTNGHCNNGVCGGCLQNSDCPGVTNFCGHPVCNTPGATTGVCSYQNTAANTEVLPDPTGGDCKGMFCTGANGNMVEGNKADPPLAAECTTASCNMGTAVVTNLDGTSRCSNSGFCNGAGACVQCNTAPDCGVDPECSTPTCVNNLCGTFQEPTTTQCTQGGNVCDGMGTCVACNVAADCGVATTCLTFACNASHACVPANTSINTACTEFAGGGVCDGTGSCVACNTTAQCPIPANVCLDPLCTNHACATTPVGNNTEKGTQVSGDCQHHVCDGAGALVLRDDATDLPPTDSNECTTEACTGSPLAPVHTPAAEHSPCGTGQFCAVAPPACVACITAVDCPVPANDCDVASCVLHVCGFAAIPLGDPARTQVTGDCQTKTCDGVGGSSQVYNAADPTLDPDGCTDDVCNMGSPPTTTHPNSPATTMCTNVMNMASFCDGLGHCP